jgi:hypothetical protein
MRLLRLAFLISFLLIAPPTGAEPVRVELRGEGGSWQLFRDGKPYFIQGAGGDAPLKALRDAGGNSTRTWGTDHIDKLLDDAQANGLTVAVGIWLGHVGHGFRYDNPRQVERQLQYARQAILKYRDHPAVLLWGIGNEVEAGGQEGNEAVYRAINDIAAMAHQLDPNHPTMTVVANVDPRKVEHLNRLCPDVDVIGINCYGPIGSLPKRYKAAGGTKPYVVTEFGPPGMWESAQAFGEPRELTSTQKAARYKAGWEAAVASQKDGACLGGYAFLWGHKQEGSATWFGMFLDDGARLAAIDAMSECWTGRPVANYCPAIQSLKLDGADDVEAGATVRATVEASDAERDPLTIKWVLRDAKSVAPFNSDRETPPRAYPDAIVNAADRSADVKLPVAGGTYRLFVYVYDDHGGAATANVLIHVKKRS